MSTHFIGECPPKRVRKVGVEWLRTFEWDSVWTLTFDKYVPRERARQATNRWFQTLAQDVVRVHFRVAWAVEQWRLGELFHVHLQLKLLGNDVVLDNVAAHRAWRDSDAAAGYTKPKRYVRGVCDERSHEPYLGKAADWDVTIACPRPPRCRRAHGCDFLSGTWS